MCNHANTGEANVVLPNEDTTITRARVKVKGAGNVFFNVNKGDFSIYHSDLPFSEISVFPSPVHNTLRIYTGSQGKQEFAIYNALGQRMLTGEADGQLDIPVFYWARGVYFIRFVSGKGHFARKFVVQ